MRWIQTKGFVESQLTLELFTDAGFQQPEMYTTESISCYLSDNHKV